MTNKLVSGACKLFPLRLQQRIDRGVDRHCLYAEGENIHTHSVSVLWRSTNCLAHHHRVCALAPTMMMACALTPLWGIRDETTDSTAEKTVSVSRKDIKGKLERLRSFSQEETGSDALTRSVAHSLTQSLFRHH